jgi:Kef-type K+ transport system membrane component KefB
MGERMVMKITDRVIINPIMTNFPAIPRLLAKEENPGIMVARMLFLIFDVAFFMQWHPYSLILGSKYA